MRVKIEIEIKNCTDVVEAIRGVAEIYEMSGSKSETSHIEGGGSMSYNINIEEQT